MTQLLTVGVPRERKPGELRVALTPNAVAHLTERGAPVVIEDGAGAGAGFTDDEYRRAGARMLTRDVVFGVADLVVKVKEPQPEEVPLLRPGQLLFTYLHLAADLSLARALAASEATCIAYEAVTDAAGGFPLLLPMSEIAGRLAVQAAATALEVSRGGRGVLLGAVGGVPPAHVAVIGGGVVGEQAAIVALGMGASVTVLDTSLPRLRTLERRFGGCVRLELSTRGAVDAELRRADAVIGAVLLPGDRAPRVVRRDDLADMAEGTVMVDVAIDQGGCFESSRPTTHDAPSYVVDGIVHVCVANLPGAVPRTSTRALVNATLPYVARLAEGGLEAVHDSDDLRAALAVHARVVTSAPVRALLAGDPVAA